ncbi:nicotinate-nucleotide adenylyltransferase [Thermoflavifilum aggregans]|uniref:Probable nicotinate-nucleotide adenylyltransferase n=1 Tax=Thermoflavifilum aggregans TaxID=454188 RepID=A0A2M9CRQ3_9BACT|nr:nicotinate (nicotinamide) nucleotide adenylyltransferase [Thermoflavifilum aggregans]MBX6380409.1 nicotinate-nucleotide adenylyltransferase [Thermoflavifilum aggregans]PJJ74593.1 nicotinate-nucleotide adenylyltransferase [Thermoflavifilum aggregans]
MKIGLFFGSFNPIHHGHLIIASYLAYETDLDKVWLVVSPQNPFKPAGSLLNEYQRLHLAQLAVEGDPRLEASAVEFSLPKPSYTADTLAYLFEKYPHHQFALIMGSDSLQNFPRWKNAGWIQAHVGFYIYPRAGFPVKPDDLPPQGQIVQAPLLDISASLIRRRIREGKPIRYLVPDSVAREIENSHYYR